MRGCNKKILQVFAPSFLSQMLGDEAAGLASLRDHDDELPEPGSVIIEPFQLRKFKTRSWMSRRLESLHDNTLPMEDHPDH
jgi:hypothetical protein